MSGKRNGIYCPDKRLFPRIKQVYKLYSVNGGVSIRYPPTQCIGEGSGESVEDVLTALLATYPEYNRKKRSTFLTKVEDSTLFQFTGCSYKHGRRLYSLQTIRRGAGKGRG